ncbi:MAG: hypothetical protein PHF70_05670 [Opitutales bacterium]|nr:hypothetical protein [Opitutales bacterium]
MDNLEDIVVPIIIGIVFLLQAIFGRKRPNGEEDDDPTAADDPSDQFRKIRDEIQRRIEENRRKQEGGSSPAAPHQPAGSQRIPTMRPASTAAPTPQRTSTHRPAAAHEVSGAERMRQMQLQIDEARKRARKDELRAAAIRRETQERARVYGGYSTRSSHSFQSTADLVDSVVSDLQDPVSARKALLFSEIFGAPLGLRSSGASRPLWEK